ncbi:MAG TPA: RES domain-containing protein [Edaphobacter sp.]|nr:RES domain-containing protein [Edaphobacter sp.]
MLTPETSSTQTQWGTLASVQSTIQTASSYRRFTPARPSTAHLWRRSFTIFPSKPASSPSRSGRWYARPTPSSGPAIDLRLIDLSTIALHKLGIDRAHLIDTTKAQYPRTRGWVEALYSQFPDAQGLSWTSRRHDHAQAVILFGTRVKTSDLTIAGPSTVLLEDSDAILSVVDLATKLGATLVD